MLRLNNVLVAAAASTIVLAVAAIGAIAVPNDDLDSLTRLYQSTSAFFNATDLPPCIAQLSRVCLCLCVVSFLVLSSMLVVMLLGNCNCVNQCLQLTGQQQVACHQRSSFFGYATFPRPILASASVIAIGSMLEELSIISDITMHGQSLALCSCLLLPLAVAHRLSTVVFVSLASLCAHPDVTTLSTSMFGFALPLLFLV